MPAFKSRFWNETALLLGLGLSLVVVSLPSYGQPEKATSVGTPTPSEPAPLTLKEAFKKAKQFNTALMASRAGREAQKQDLAISKARRLPKVSLSVSRSKVNQDREDSGSIQTSTNYDSHADTVSVRQPLYAPALQAEIDRQEALVESLDASDFLDQLALFNRVSEAYWQWILSEHENALLKAQARVIAQRLTAAQLQFDSGRGTRTDVFEVSAESDKIAASVLLAQQQRDTNWLNLQRLMGASYTIPPSDWAAKQELTLRLLSKTKTLLVPEAAYPRLLANHPEISARRAELKAAESRARSVSARHYPTVDLVGQASKTQGESAFFTTAKTDSQSFGIQLSWSLYEGGEVLSAERQAAFEIEQAHLRLEDAQSRLSFEYQRNFLEYQASDSRAQALERALTSAQRMVMANQRSYEAGFRSLLDILTAENAALLAANGLFQAQVDALKAWVQASVLLVRSPDDLLSFVDDLQ